MISINYSMYISLFFCKVDWFDSMEHINLSISLLYSSIIYSFLNYNTVSLCIIKYLYNVWNLHLYHVINWEINKNKNTKIMPSFFMMKHKQMVGKWLDWHQYDNNLWNVGSLIQSVWKPIVHVGNLKFILTKLFFLKSFLVYG